MFERMTNSPALTDRVTGALLEKIDGGVFRPGARLPSEIALAKQFGVSRTVLREAISRLKQEGVVEGRQGSGVYLTEQAGVKPLKIEIASVGSLESILQIMELRRAIEAEAASQAALRRTDAQWRKIEAALKRIDEDVAAGKDGVAADMDFHRNIAQASGNPFITKTLGFLSQYLESARRVTRANDARRADFSRQLRQEHTTIAVAIHNRDPFAARNAAEAHMFNVAHRLSEVMATAAPIEERRSLTRG
jgi:GntR family transcriptional regulator, transcriptional repressor for pyruvate dehydrogenase complex